MTTPVQQMFQGSPCDGPGQALPYLRRLLATSNYGDLAAAIGIVADSSREGWSTCLYPVPIHTDSLKRLGVSPSAAQDYSTSV